MSKKGQLDTLAPAVFALIIAAFFLVMGLIILETTKNTAIVTQSQSTTVLNETLNLNTSAVADFADFLTVPSFNSPAILAVYNVTGGVVLIDAANYTLVVNASNQGITAAAVIDVGINATDVNVTYSYKHGDEAYDATNTTAAGLGNFSDFWEIIILTIILSIVMGMILAAFSRQIGR